MNFRANYIFEKDRNMTFFAIYFHKINILPVTWAHYMQNFINFHAIIRKKIQLVSKKIKTL